MAKKKTKRHKFIPDKLSKQIEKHKEKDTEVQTVVNGVDVTLKQWKVFQTYCTEAKGSVVKTAELMGMCKQAIYNIMNHKSGVWAAMTAEYITSNQDYLMAGLSSMSGDILVAIDKIVKGEFEGNENAVVKILEAFAKMGKGHGRDGKHRTEPISTTNPQVFIDQSRSLTVRDERKIAIDIGEMINDMKPHEHLEYAKEGIVPDRFYKKD